MSVPLRIFEPRYREFARAVTLGSGCFATVMIERGSEVGGLDQRSDVGCRLRVTDSVELDDGTWRLAATALDRIRVTKWLVDEPYPRAMIRPWPDDDDDDDDEQLREASWRMAAALPIGELDRQRLLMAPSTGERLALLREMTAEQRSLIDLITRHGGEPSS